MQENKIELIELKDAVIQRPQVFGIAKTEVPATLHTAAIPCNIIYVNDNQPINIGYGSVDERDAEFDMVVDRLKKWSW